MIGYVWRVPIVLGITACSALVLFAGTVIASIVIRRRTSIATIVALTATVGCLAIGAVMAIRVTAWHAAQSFPVDVQYVDPGPGGYVAPPLFAALAFIIGDRFLRRTWTNQWALVFCAWLFTFTALNTINYCSPGWCETIGFPLPWRTWSDSILTLGNPDLVEVAIERSAPAIAALLDVCVFVAVASVLTRGWIRRSVPRSEANSRYDVE
jgi:hypothetical protein